MTTYKCPKTMRGKKKKKKAERMMNDCDEEFTIGTWTSDIAGSADKKQLQHPLWWL